MRFTQRPIATGRGRVLRLCGDDAADNPADDGGASGITVVVMVVMMMVVLGKLYDCRRLLCSSRIVGFQERHRIRDRFEKISISGRRLG